MRMRARPSCHKHRGLVTCSHGGTLAGQKQLGEHEMSDLSAFPITKRWPPQHPDRLQLYSLPTPNGVKVAITLEEVGLPYEVQRVPGTSRWTGGRSRSGVRGSLASPVARGCDIPL